MNYEISNLLDEILIVAKKKGWEQKDLAFRAQIPESTISRAKKNNDIRFSTLQALARAVGLKVALVPDSLLAEDILKGALFND